jgi:hypothetical protein
MSSRHSASLHKQLVDITHVYLGPAAERFINRQIENHLRKSPEQLTPDDLLSLIDWIRIGVSLLTEDSELIEEYIGELQRLAASHNKPERSDNGR